MTSKKRVLSGVFWQVFFSVLALFLCFTPVFYWIVLHNLERGDHRFSYPYAIVQILRFALVIGAACIIRNKNRNILVQYAAQGKTFMKVILSFLIIGIILRISNIIPHLYGEISALLQIYNLEVTPLFLAVLWEQLFAGALYWSVLLAMVIVLFRQKPEKGNVSIAAKKAGNF